jgi:WD40 repeat protein
VRTLFASIAVALLVALWQWRTAVNERDAAQAQARVATSRKLVADSRLPGRPLDFSLLLAAEAYQIAPTRDAHEHLIRLAHENDRFEQFLQGHQAPVTAVAFHRGRMLAADEKGRLSLWERGGHSSGRKLQLVQTVTTAPDQPVQALRVTPKGDRAVVVHRNGLVGAVGIGESTLDVRSNAQCPDWAGAQVVLNADGSRAAVRQEDGTAAVWRLDASACVLDQALGPVPTAIALSPSGHYLAAPRPEGGVMWWSVDGRSGGSVPARSSDPYGAFMVVISGDDSRMAVASLNRLTVWHVDPDGKTTQVLTSSIEGRFRSMAFSRRGDKLAVGMADGMIDLWRLGQDGPVREQLRGHRYGFHVVDVAFNDSGTMLASGAEDGILMLWYLGYTPHDKVLVRELHGHAHPIALLAFDADRGVASASGTAVILWNAGVGWDKPFLSHLGRNESVGSSHHDPATGVTLSLPGIVLRDEDTDGCWLVADARASAGRRLTAEERQAAIGDLTYTPTCPELDTPEE